MRAGLLREARLSVGALAHNLESLLSDVAADDAVVDVRADAYGHGLEAVVRNALDHGIRRFRVSRGVGLPPGASAVAEGTAPHSHELAAYGLDDPDRTVLSLVGEVLAVKRVPRGSGVSYGYSYRTSAESTLALVSLGYADGVPRLGSNAAFAAVRGSRAPIAGRIAMDQFVLDVHDAAVEVGDEVTVWGAAHTGAPSAAEWARTTKRRAADLTSGLARRVDRRWVNA